MEENLKEYLGAFLIGLLTTIAGINAVFALASFLEKNYLKVAFFLTSVGSNLALIISLAKRAKPKNQ